MTAALPKRLIEVDLPIKRISAHARREKSIRHGHISTLHIWWARRPLAACRAVLCASLWPDPADPNCPDSFRVAARQWMKRWSNEYLKNLGRESYERFVGFQNNPGELENNEQLRYALLDFIADFANWDNSAIQPYVETSRGLTQAAHEALGGAAGTRPLVVDPFAGGGSIPLEALRIGADVFASDLNPVPVLLNKVVLEYIPKYGQRLADEVRKWGEWIKREAANELSEFYPKDADGATPIAYLWARTIQCEGPGCGVELPMLRSPWLSKKAGRMVALRILGDIARKCVDFQIVHDPAASDVSGGTAKRGSVTCPCCGYTTPVARVRAQLKPRLGGADDARMYCVVTSQRGRAGRAYRLPNASDIEACARARNELQKRKSLKHDELSIVPDEVLPAMSGVFNAPLYGHTTWGSLFTSRQLLSLTTLVRLVEDARQQMQTSSSDLQFSEAVQTCLAFAVSKLADFGNSCTRWGNDDQGITALFSRQAIPMVWDFAEANLAEGESYSWQWAARYPLGVIEQNIKAISVVGTSMQLSATAHSLPDNSAQALITDPPYYNAVPYADLSDFFYVWLRRSLRSVHPTLFAEPLSPKAEECCEMAGWDADRYAIKNGKWFETQMTKSLAEGRRVLSSEGIGCVVFAHKSTSGWEAQLGAMMDSGWVITGSWPIDTEMAHRLRAQKSAALASSIHLVCRPRASFGGLSRMEEVGDWRDVLHELPLRIHAWMPRLAEEGVVGADAIFACLGPALEIFSRYSSVEKASGQTVHLREYLEQVWAAVAKEALAVVFQGADASGFEEDARLTAMWLWTLFAGETSNGEPSGEETSEDDEREEAGSTQNGYVLDYDTARKIAQGLGAHLESLTSLVEVKGEAAMLLPVAERTRRLFGKDESEAPALLRKKKTSQLQLGFVAELEQAEEAGSWGSKGAPAQGATVLDRVHQCMILFAAGRGEALRRFLVDEGVGRDERFWRLAQVLSFLYPKASDEKRWIDGVLARKKGLGF
jgi:adenine-specific DNA methylase